MANRKPGELRDAEALVRKLAKKLKQKINAEQVTSIAEAMLLTLNEEIYKGAPQAPQAPGPGDEDMGDD